MKNWQSWYWKFFNALGRVVGVIFMIFGAIIALFSQVGIHGSQQDSLSKWGGTAAGLLAAFLGFLLFKARPSNLPR
jgi:hypothetical protein